MFGKIIDQIEKEHGGDAVMGVYVSLIAEIKRTFILQQKKIDKIKKDYSKIEKERLKKNKKKEDTRIYFNGVFTGKVNRNKLPHGKGTHIFTSRDKDYPDENDIYMGEFSNGTRTGLGKYTYFNGRNIGKHPFSIPYFIGEWSGDSYYGLGSKLMDEFDTLQTFEGEFSNNKIFGFGKWVDKRNEGDLELIGYFDDGMAVGFGLRIQKDKKGKIIADQSGLCEYDNSDLNNKKSILHLKFPGDLFWEAADIKGKRKPIIQTIYDAIIEKGYFDQTIKKEKFKKIKLKLQSQHLILLDEINEFYNKNIENKKFEEFVNLQGELKNYLFTCKEFENLKECDEMIKKSISDFKVIKKQLKK